MKRLAAAIALVLALAACAPTVEADLPTPGTALTYGWVMAHHYQDWGVQIGPKTDAAGTHVAVYAWIDCRTGCAYEYFQRFDSLVPGSVHHYRIVWNGQGWECWFDGRLVATLNLGGPSSAIYEVNYEERTTR